MRIVFDFFACLYRLVLDRREYARDVAIPDLDALDVGVCLRRDGVDQLSELLLGAYLLDAV